MIQKRAVAVSLSLSITLASPGSLVLSAFAEGGIRAASSKASTARTPAVGAVSILAPASSKLLGNDGSALKVVPGLVRTPPAIEASLAEGGRKPLPQALPFVQAPGASLRNILPALLNENGQSLPAASGLGRVSEASSGDQKTASDPTAVKEAHDRVYDAAEVSPDSSPAPAGEGVSAQVPSDWTLNPPQIPLASLKPRWQEAAGPSAPDLRYRFEAGALVNFGEEAALSAVDDLKVETIANPLKNLSSEEETLAYGRREYFQAYGLKRSALQGSAVTWVDGEGKLNIYDPKSGMAVSVEPPMGPIESYAVSQTLDYVYAYAGGHLQRWDLAQKKAVVILDERLSQLGIQEISPLRRPGLDGDGIEARTAKGMVYWTPKALSLNPGGPEEVYAQEGVAPSLRDAGNGFFIESLNGSSRVWSRTLSVPGAPVSDMGSLPFDVKALSASADRKTLFAATERGFVEWDTAGRRYRFFEIPGLGEAALGRPVSIDLSPESRHVLVTAGERLFYVDLGDAPREMESKEAQLRLWSEDSPMYIKDGSLRIGDFSFPVQPSKIAAKLPWYQRLWNWLLRRKNAPEQAGPAVTEKEWKALNLPSNKWVIYQTLKAFTLGHNVLYIGETGSGKTWMAAMIAKLTRNELWMASLNEYTRNQDLVARDTFGEEGDNKTGLTPAVALKFLMHGGIGLFDELHKPIEGLAILNNILQNFEYRLPDGRIIKGDRGKSFVIATMNPVKPPYKGEPPSGELSSRFGLTIEVNYLPPAEEAALLEIFHPGVAAKIAKKLVDVAKDLRKIFPEVLPLPISSRTLLHIVEHMARFPGDDPLDVFKGAYNPGTIVEDPSIVSAIEKALEAHDLAGRRDGEAEKKKTLTD